MALPLIKIYEDGTGVFLLAKASRVPAPNWRFVGYTWFVLCDTQGNELPPEMVEMMLNAGD